MGSKEVWGSHLAPITTDKHLSDLRQKHGVPPMVDMILSPGSPYSPETVPEGFCCAYTTYFERCGLVFPIPGIIFLVLRRLRMAFPQMCPNFVRHVIGLFVRAQEEGLVLGVDGILQMCYIKHNSGYKGTYYLSRRPDREILQGIPGRDDRWREKYFFFRVTSASVGAFNFSQLPTQWAINVDTGDCPLTSELRALTDQLRNGRVRWNTFTRARIVQALNRPTPLAAPSQQRISSSSSTTAPSQMTRKPTLREAREQSTVSRRVRAGDVDAALASALRGLPSAPAARSVEVNQDLMPSANKVIMLVNSQTKSSELPAPQSKRARTETRPSRDGRPYESRGSYRRDPHGSGARLDQLPDDKAADSGQGSSASRPFHWKFAHSKDSPAVEDPIGMANLFRHLKSLGCPIPLVRDLAERDAYIDAMSAQALALAAQNKLVALYERRLTDVPQTEELENTKKVVHELTVALRTSQTREVELEERVTALKKDLLAMSAVRAKLVATEGDLTNALLSKNAAVREKDALAEEVERLTARLKTGEAVRDSAIRRAVRASRAEMSEAYRQVLEGIKSKWEKKKAEAACDSELAETVSNLLLLEQIEKGRATVEGEKEVLRS
ncbi:uncharacterized protein At3g60930, chloroplastic-like [Capsella rubella]|uniref:uncharacterized protein At3g60930, chloroplastic-like n=1 Tax=Capsella rubella TaxID=81985 RepID=UPI000CD4EED1|nr:uncharacterized protein At3g60930, chloroplastic-like [Capsella rubella]